MMRSLSENQFCRIFERSPLGMAVVDAKSGRFLAVNPRFAAIVGLSEEALAGFDWRRLTHPEDLPLQQERMAQLAAGTIASFQIDKPYLRADGRSAWWRLSVSALDSDGALRFMALVEETSERVQQEQANSAAREFSERRLGALVAQGLAGTAEADLECRLTYVNERYCQIVGHPRETLLGRHLGDFTTPEDWARQQSLFADLLAGGEANAILAKRYVRRDGTLSHAQVAFVLVRDAAGAPAGYSCLVTDTNELKRTEHELRDSEQRYRALNAELESKVARRTAELTATKERIVDAMARVSRSEMKFRAVFEQSPLGIALVDPLGGRVLEANERFATICGFTRDDLAQLDWSRLVRPDELPRPWSRSAPIESFRIDQRHLRQGQEAWMRVTFAPLNIEAEGRCCHLALVEDITQQKLHERELEQAREAIIDANLALQAANAELKQLATTDPLTGTWNRRHFQQVIAAEIKQALRYGQQLSLLLFDLDHFKSINDRHGHQVGDQVLVALTRLLQRNLRSTDVLARWGGEEFAVVMPHCGANEAASLAEKLRALIAGWEFTDVGCVTVSCGLAEYQPPETLDSWLKRADDALYAAKSSGRNLLCQAA